MQETSIITSTKNNSIKNASTGNTSTENNSFATASGKIDYRLTNDYMFRAMLQENKPVLKALICALLHLQPEDVISIEITNPIELGKHIDNKDFILDILVSLNNNSLINLEMQVENLLNWKERSLCYLCRTFDNLNSGQNYKEIKPAIHIGFLDFTLFPDTPEFYATYKLRNVRNGHIYSDKFILSVVDLTQIKLATEEDKLYQIDYWAKLFKAKTWEELKMISEKNDTIREASESLYTLNADEMIRQQCRAREDYYGLQNAINYKMEKLSSEKERLEAENEALSSENESLSSENKNLTSEVENLKKLLIEHGISY